MHPRDQCNVLLRRTAARKKKIRKPTKRKVLGLKSHPRVGQKGRNGTEAGKLEFKNETKIRSVLASMRIVAVHRKLARRKLKRVEKRISIYQATVNCCVYEEKEEAPTCCVYEEKEEKTSLVKRKAKEIKSKDK